MREYARLARPFLVMLAIVTAGRWLLGTAFHVDYQKGTGAFSIVTLTVMASLFSTGYTRAWLGFRIGRAVGFAMFMGVLSQLVILASTAASYLAGIDSYFNNPAALNRTEAVSFGAAMAIRLSGLIGNTLLNAIAGALGWALGGLLPSRDGR